MSLSAALTALLLTVAPQDSTVATAQHLLFERCPAALRDGAGPSETVATTDGMNVYWGVSVQDRSCDVFLQWRVDDSLSAIRARLEAEGWEAAGLSAWTREGQLVLISRFEEDGVPGATVILAEAGGPLGARFAAHRRRAQRPLVEAARLALFDLCPALANGEEAERRQIVTAEPELFGSGPAADPAEGQIRIDLRRSVCTVKLSGPLAAQTVDALRQDAEGRGYAADAHRRLWAEDWVILTQEVVNCPPTMTGCTPTFFNVQLFDRAAFESVLSGNRANAGEARR
ncbi:MAG: hypothetical protein KKG14_08840 [Alphaproteobacteria bacterium]|nr:hypothetical protein [Alphaproteobacteria bacterium]MBU2271422.1 hypothetical protein [Alphaproteobacteria bacterium]MBU2418794.1 hypothetical protein [Alphaproteobacteria bacterium]